MNYANAKRLIVAAFVLLLGAACTPEQTVQEEKKSIGELVGMTEEARNSHYEKVQNEHRIKWESDLVYLRAQRPVYMQEGGAGYTIHCNLHTHLMSVWDGYISSPVGQEALASKTLVVDDHCQVLGERMQTGEVVPWIKTANYSSQTTFLRDLSLAGVGVVKSAVQGMGAQALANRVQCKGDGCGGGISIGVVGGNTDVHTSAGAVVDNESSTSTAVEIRDGF